jgi:hypothetical protein
MPRQKADVKGLTVRAGGCPAGCSCMTNITLGVGNKLARSYSPAPVSTDSVSAVYHGPKKILEN